jgi:hypothetical protein
MKHLAEWVVETNLVTPAQLEEAKKLQSESGLPLAMALIQLKMIDERALVDLVSAKHAMPKAPRRMHRLTVAPKVLSLIPQDFCWQYGVFPFGIDPVSRKLQVAIVDPADEEAVAALKKLPRAEVMLYAAGPKQVEKAIRKHYLDSWIEETNASKPLRYFGYENITAPGVNPALPAGALSGPAAGAPPPSRDQLRVLGPAPQLRDTVVDQDCVLTWEEAPGQGTAPAPLPAPGAEGTGLPPSSNPPPGPAVSPVPPLRPVTSPAAPLTRSPTPLVGTVPPLRPVTSPVAPLTRFPTPPVGTAPLPEPALANAPTPQGGIPLGRVTRQEQPSLDLAARVEAVERVLNKLLTLLARGSREASLITEELRRELSEKGRPK